MDDVNVREVARIRKQTELECAAMKQAFSR